MDDIELDYIIFRLMPTPTKGESKDHFLQRCMAFPDMQHYPAEQRYAVCQSKWSEHQMAEPKTSFDFDGVLSTSKGKELAKQTKGPKYIISARSDKQPMISTASQVGISEHNIYATGSNKNKIEKIKQLGISKHYDNNPDIVKELGNIGQLFNG